MGETNEDGFDFRLVLVILDANNTFPVDFDKIGVIEMYLEEFYFDPVKVINDTTRTNLKFSTCTEEYTIGIGSNSAQVFPKKMIPEVNCLDLD